MKKKFYLLLVAAIASMFALAGCGESTTGYKELTAYTNEDSKTETISNSALELTVDKDSSTFVLEDKAHGKVYRSNPTPEDIEKYANAKGQLKDVLNATMVLTYSNSTNTQKEINNYNASIADGNYRIEKVSETEIDVYYTVGDVEKLFVCPLVIKESKMKKYLDQMSETDQKVVTRNYLLYDYEDLSESDDDTELQQALALFPDLKDEPIYYLSEKITDSKAKGLEEIFVELGYTEEERNKDSESYNVSRNSGKPIFDIVIQYILEDGELVVKVPMEKIEYNPDYPIVELSVLPYMGAGSSQDKGFVLVPDGMGGIINFNNGKTGQQTYLSEMYGWDYGISRKMVVDESRSAFPVFAVSNETVGGSFVCISEEGSSYSSVKADIAGKENGYNYGRFVYKMVHGEDMDISKKSDTTVRSYEESLPKENLTQRYIFSDKMDYVSMAQDYRDYMMKRYPELTKKEDATVPMAVEMIGAVDNVEHILGYPVTRSQALTTYSQAEDILKQLKAAGVESLSAKYTGWFNTGVNQKSAAKVKLVGRLGGKSDLKSLAAYASGTGGLDLFLNGKFMYVMKDKLFDGFGVNRHAAKFVSREICELYTLDPIVYQTNEEYVLCDLYYLVKPSYTIKNIDSYLSSISSYGVTNIGFEDIGNTLAGDYNPKDRVSREASMNMQADKMKSLKESGNKVMTTSGNQYAVPYSDYITDMDIDTRAVNIIDESVPFYQIALHGLVNYSGSAINLSEDQTDMILKSAETGAGLYYTFINAATSVLQDGEYTQYYACNFTDWKDSAVELYNDFNSKLGDVYNQYIVGHEKLANGVYKTTYENGKAVVVNYNYADYDYEGTTVPQRDFVTLKTGGGQ
ncbi:MAG: DUF5696 domain-containing protein [Roseburia sp.]|nr:DUF5696 domain-containing protein [Roseburia sp.]